MFGRGKKKREAAKREAEEQKKRTASKIPPKPVLEVDADRSCTERKMIRVKWFPVKPSDFDTVEEMIRMIQVAYSLDSTEEELDRIVYQFNKKQRNAA